MNNVYLNKSVTNEHEIPLICTSSISISSSNGMLCGSIPRIYGKGEQQKSISLFGKTGINICYKRPKIECYIFINASMTPYLPIAWI